MVKKIKQFISRDKLNELTSYEHVERQLLAPGVRAKWEEIHGKRVRRLMLFHEVLGSLSSRLPEQVAARAFVTQAAKLRKRLNVDAVQRKIANRKLKLLGSQVHKVVRLDNLGRVMTELGREDSFAGKQAAKGEGGVFEYPRKSSPENNASYFYRSTAHKLTQWSELAKYDAVAYLEPSAIGKTFPGHLNWEWGNVKDIGRNPIHAVQVIHWDPNVLFQFTKGMLKKRPKDPVAILDVYGRQFFP